MQTNWSVGLSKKASVGGRGSYSVPEQGFAFAPDWREDGVCTSGNVAAQYRCRDGERGHLHGGEWVEMG